MARATWVVHGTQPQNIDKILVEGLKPGESTRWGEPSGCWMSSEIGDARVHAVDKREWRRFAGFDRVRSLRAFMNEPVERDEDRRVVVIEARGLQLVRHHYFEHKTPSINFVCFDPIEASRIVGTVAELGVVEVIARLWPDPKSRPH